MPNEISDMFHRNTDVKENLKLLTITELKSILQAHMQTFEKRVGGGGERWAYKFTCLCCTAFHII